MTDYRPSGTRYDSMTHRRCGRSGLKLPAISLGLWYNFGGVDSLENGRATIRRAFDLGITHFDLANNYGSPFGSAEENFGRILAKDLASQWDELVISSQSMAQMAIAWVLRHPVMASALIGASRAEHVESAVAALERLEFRADDLAAIDAVLAA
jgi:aryl-alcohol dehydrogenase-like predicted oxidoreductase